MLKLADYMSKKKEEEFKKIERKSNTENKEIPLFTFKSPGPGETTKFTLRVLPLIGVDGKVKPDMTHFIKHIVHRGLKDSNGKFQLLMKCPRMFGDKCPICDQVSDEKALIAQAYEADPKGLYKELKSKTNFILQVLVIENENDPSLEGKIKRLYISHEVNELLLNEIFEYENDITNWENGFEVTFTIKQKENGYNGWSVRVGKKHSMTKTKLKPAEVESLESMYNSYQESTLDFVEYHNKVVDIISIASDKLQVNKKQDEKKDEPIVTNEAKKVDEKSKASRLDNFIDEEI